MKKTIIPIAIILITCVGQYVSAQYQSSGGSQNWKNIVLASKTEGINTSGYHFEYLQNTNNWWGDWLIPWRASIQLTNIRDQQFEKSKYLEATISHITLGVSGYKGISENLFLNLDGGVILGLENLTEFSGRNADRFFVGLSTSQGVLYIPDSKLALVLKGGLYQEVLTSKLYNFDIGIQVGVGLKF